YEQAAQRLSAGFRQLTGGPEGHSGERRPGDGDGPRGVRRRCRDELDVLPAQYVLDEQVLPGGQPRTGEAEG
ncbi:hypothetical protein ABZ646_45625, partial [Streptomyces sp. NPDC007162]|uniref:hypothetical protein n=1 Tax=Streptomyces sp. NPDC007162 TaxID=3156917 RepID=UPI0033E8A55D